MTEPTYFQIIEDLTFQNSWVVKPINLKITDDQFKALLMGYHVNWDMRFGLIYRYEDGYFYAYRSGWVVGKYRFEKSGEGYVCSEAYENKAKPDCYVIFDILKEACLVNNTAFDGEACSKMVHETHRLDEELLVHGDREMKRIEVVEVVPSDDAFTAKMRKKQSAWREANNLKAGFGRGKYSDKRLGNWIEDGERAGGNFYFGETLQYAQWRVDSKLPMETIDAGRLFGNLLSSMPMAFNLFHPLMMMKSENPLALDALVKRAFPTLKHLHRVTEIGLEFIPTPFANYTGDKSAMDAFIRFQDKMGNNFLIAIEVKYTDSLGTNTASKEGFSRQLAVIEELGMFTEECVSKMACKEIPITQVYRNFLLAEKYGRVHGLKEVYSMILAPEGHPSTGGELKMLRGSLKPEFQDRIFNVHLEDFIGALHGSDSMRYWHWAEWLKGRYLGVNLEY